LRDEAGTFLEGNGLGLLRWVQQSLPAEAAEGLSFFQRWACGFIQELCQIPDIDERNLTEVFVAVRPGLARCAAYVLEMPPIVGGEYASGEWLLSVHQELEEALQSAQQKSGKPFSEFVRGLNPAWRDVGKVGFHLAENKSASRDDYPFAFMASFIHRVGENDKPKHLPLSAALKAYASNPRALSAVLAPIQKAAAKSGWVSELLESRRIFQPCLWTAKEAYSFLKEIPLYEAASIVVRITNLWKQAPKKAAVTVSLEKGRSLMGMDALLDFSVQLTLEGEPLTEEEVEQLLHSSGGLIRLKGQWVEADPKKLAELLSRWQEARHLAKDGGMTFVQGLRFISGLAEEGLGGVSAADVGASQFTVSGELKQMLEDLRSPSQVALPPLPEALTSLLRHYQLDGVKYLWRTQSLGLGACLADDMGLGKTLQILALVSLWKRAGALKRLPALLVLPATLLANWKSESAKFTPELRLLLLHPSALSKEEMTQLSKVPEALLAGYDLALITYGMLPRVPALSKLEFPAVLADEAQAIKNPASKQSRAVRNLRGKQRIALTGTPVENRLSDLWSLFDFINPGLLGSTGAFKDFVKRLTDPATEQVNYAPLRKLTQPFILRRLKTDKSIISDLPDKTEIKTYCHLTPAQTALYAATVKALKEAIEATDGIQRRGLILSYLMQFKQICNHPAHFNGTGDFAFDASGKFERLSEIVEEIHARQEKVLVFTQFREMTEPLHAFLSERFGCPGLILHGGTSVKQRPELVKRFQSADGPPFFVLSLKAAGTGLNLTAANHVAHFDRWWNPAVENQASDRAFRIGQKRNVLVHKFITRGTLEEKIDELIMSKQEMADALLSGGAESLLTNMTNDELLKFVSLDIKTLEV
jgi:non-specific serine/threonine protein kinase